MKIAVIGAGLSGVTLAKELSVRNFDVQIFEKSCRVGGRLSHRILPWGNIDFGAQYFTARDERFQRQVEKWVAAGVVGVWHFSPHRVAGEKLLRSPDNNTRYVGLPNMNAIAHAQVQAGNFKVHYEKAVASLKRDNGKWQLSINNGDERTGGFDWVISSLPAEQARTLLRDQAISKQIPSHVHSPCWAVALATKGKVDFDIQGIFGDDIVAWVSRQSSKPGCRKDDDYDDLWMVHFSSRWSELHESAPAEIVTSEAIGWLAEKLKDHSDGRCSLRYSMQHFWRYAQISDQDIKDQLIVDKKNGIAQVGAWQSKGRVEGAYLSAMELLGYYF